MNILLINAIGNNAYLELKYKDWICENILQELDATIYLIICTAN